MLSKLRAFTVASLLLLVALAGGGRALACSCVHLSPCEASSTADAVFVGTVLSFTKGKEKFEESGQEYEYATQISRFQVEEAFTNLNGATQVDIETVIDSPCGLPLTSGTRYLIFARRDKQSDRFATGMCSGTRAAAYAEEYLVYLRSTLKEPPGATLSGQVVYRSGLRDEDSPDLGVETVGVNTVILEGEGQRQEARIDRDGHYSFAGVAAGKYRLYVSTPDDLTTLERYSDYAEDTGPYDPREIKVLGHGCLPKNFVVTDNGRISGNVTDEDGKPAAHILVNLVHITPAGELRGVGNEWNDDLMRRTDEAGNYQFKGLPPGSYLIGVRLGGRVEGDSVEAAYPRTYYPGVPTQKKAVVVPLGKGESVTGRDFQLPSRLARRIVRGRVLLRNGRPAAKVRVRYVARTPDRKRSDPQYLRTDEDGNFSFVGYEGNAYLVGAFVDRQDKQEEMYAREVEIAPRGKAGFVKLTLDQPGATARDFDEFHK